MSTDSLGIHAQELPTSVAKRRKTNIEASLNVKNPSAGGFVTNPSQLEPIESAQSRALKRRCVKAHVSINDNIEESTDARIRKNKKRRTLNDDSSLDPTRTDLRIASNETQVQCPDYNMAFRLKATLEEGTHTHARTCRLVAYK